MAIALAATACAALLAGPALAAPGSPNEPAAEAPAGSAVWLCRPGLADDPCGGSLATTIQKRDGSSRVVTPRQSKRPAIDCFYVYPTVSEEPTANASLNVTPPVRAIAQFQAARFSQVCDMYAPVYRQVTLTALNGGGTGTPDFALGYTDVLSAWRQYMSQDNHGRGVVLIGHSQGTGMLRQLIKEEIDPNPAVRKQLVSALLIGGGVTVPRDKDIGGDFTSIPLCRRPGQTGCVIAYSTYNETPPAGALFARVAAPPGGPELEIACTNPASLYLNHRRTARTIQRSEPFPGLIGAALSLMYGGTPPTAATPYLVPADTYTIQCQRLDGAHVLLATPQAGSQPLIPSPSPEWGLHLADINIAQGDLVRIVAIQAKTYRWSHRHHR